ncbi:Putative NADPH dehydrogenase [Herminiimonas arsenicoxydans]|uniref:NADPH dehydrogenase n=1 Tax=Herminiimonas arsenicoxydans TaxID=204773 RepID=A4G827_HERAR|nr:Putative NADPH dehydrogenase [Herminiimonas arsenicoxydans]
MATLFEPLKLRDIKLRNRIGIPPMCQYSAQDGMPSAWHTVHYGSRAIGGAGLMILEATAVSEDGRISTGDLGIWKDAHIEPLSHIARFATENECAAAIQLAHAGRKAGVALGWQEQGSLPPNEGGWRTHAPSPIAFGPKFATPVELNVNEITTIVATFASAARRALAAGFPVIEIHAAHGYLLHQFLSPLSNKRTDDYGGSFINRTRMLREVITSVRAVWPDRLPMLVRLSATDWADHGWNIEETIELCRQMAPLGVDLVDVSSGGLVPDVTVPEGPGYQTEFSARIRRESGMRTSAVGMITSPEQADHVIRSEQADLVLIGREILRDPYWPLHAARALGFSIEWPAQYGRAAPPGSTSRMRHAVCAP